MVTSHCPLNVQNSQCLSMWNHGRMEIKWSKVLGFPYVFWYDISLYVCLSITQKLKIEWYIYVCKYIFFKKASHSYYKRANLSYLLLLPGLFYAWYKFLTIGKSAIISWVPAIWSFRGFRQEIVWCKDINKLFLLLTQNWNFVIWVFIILLYKRHI